MLKAPDFFGDSKAAAGAKPGDPAKATAKTIVGKSSDLQRKRIRFVLDDLVGTPFTPGGRTPAEGLDGPGLVWYVYGAIQRQVPDDPEDQQRLGTRLAADVFTDRGRLRDDARFLPGDILFFRVGAPRQEHSGLRPVLYYGDGVIVFSSGAKGRVVAEPIRDRAGALAFVQRVLE